MGERPSRTAIPVSPEDSAGYRRGSKSPKPGNAGTGGGRRRPGGSGGGGQRMIGINLLLAVLVAGLVVAGWFIANQHEQLVSDKKALAEASDRIGLLEDRLRMTDENLSETGQDTKSQINFWESEIRKLWAVINDRHKKSIEDNKTGIEKLGKDLQGLQAANRELTNSVGRHDTMFKQQQAILDQLTGLELSIQQMASTQRDIVDRVNTTSQTVAGLQTGLVNRVAENEQAVAAIDAYRMQINSRLGHIERRLDSLGDPTL